MANNRSENFEDWINHHLGIGFDHIYLYNYSTINGFKSLLAEYPDRFHADKVTVVDFPYGYRKNYVTASYADCYRRHRQDYDWIAFIDPN